MSPDDARQYNEFVQELIRKHDEYTERHFKEMSEMQFEEFIFRLFNGLLEETDPPEVEAPTRTLEELSNDVDFSPTEADGSTVLLEDTLDADTIDA